MRMLKMIVCSVLVGAMCMPALAQDGPPRGGRGGAAGAPGQDGGRGNRGMVPGRQMLPPEQAKAAWEVQATGVAKSLNLNDDQTKHVVKVYSEVREEHGAKMRELMDKFRQPRGEDGQIDPDAARAQGEEMRKSFTDLNTSQREKLKAGLASSLSEEQTDKAMIPLGSFNSNWDVMTATVVGFKLPAEKQEQAIVAMQKYVTTIAAAMGANDPEGMRDANQKARTELNDEMKALLNEEQFGQFQRARAGGGPAAGRGGEGGGQRGARGGRGGRGGGQGGGQGGDGGDEPSDSPE